MAIEHPVHSGLREVGVFCVNCGYVGKPDDCGCGRDQWHVAVYADRKQQRSGDGPPWPTRRIRDVPAERSK